MSTYSTGSNKKLQATRHDNKGNLSSASDFWLCGELLMSISSGLDAVQIEK